MKTDRFKEISKVFMENISIIMNDSIHIISNNKLSQIIPIEQDEDFILEHRNFILNNHLLQHGSDSQSKSVTFAAKNVEVTPDTVGDTYLNSEIALPHIDHEYPQLARVSKRMKNFAGNSIGTANKNPILDTRQYLVEYFDGHEEAMHTNLITEHMYAQVDEDGHIFSLLTKRVDHRYNPYTTVKEENSYLSNDTGQKSRIHNTEGLDLLVSWKDGSTTQIPLK